MALYLEQLYLENIAYYFSLFPFFTGLKMILNQLKNLIIEKKNESLFKHHHSQFHILYPKFPFFGFVFRNLNFANQKLSIPKILNV